MENQNDNKYSGKSQIMIMYGSIEAGYEFHGIFNTEQEAQEYADYVEFINPRAVQFVSIYSVTKL